MELPQWPQEEQHETLNTDGLQRVGEVSSWAFRDVLVEPDHAQARVAAAAEAYRECEAYILARLAQAGPYDDVRALDDMRAWLGDKIREVHSNATNGTDGA